jgi:hypothetical protein
VFLMTRGLPLLFELGLTIFCLIDCVQTPPTTARNLPKWAWIALIVVFPLIGSIAWLISGRPSAADRAKRHSGLRHPRPIAPDDDPDFLRELGRLNGKHEEPPKD